MRWIDNEKCVEPPMVFVVLPEGVQIVLQVRFFRPAIVNNRWPEESTMGALMERLRHESVCRLSYWNDIVRVFAR